MNDEEMVTAVEAALWSMPPPAVGGPDFREGGALNAGRCEGCGHWVIVGHVVSLYHDVGEVHVDCENPYAIPATEPEGTEDDPKAYVMVGYPLQALSLADHYSRVRNMVKEPTP